MQVHIRQATDADCAVLADLIRRAFRDVAERFGLNARNCPTHPSYCQDDWIASDLAKGRRYFLLEANGQPAGCAAIGFADEQTGTIERLAVLPTCRNRGLGKLLLEHAVQALQKDRLARVQLAIIASHTELQAWYERRGFALSVTRHFPHLPFRVAFLTRALGSNETRIPRDPCNRA